MRLIRDDLNNKSWLRPGFVVYTWLINYYPLQLYLFDFVYSFVDYHFFNANLPMKKFLPLLVVLFCACKQKEYNADLLVKDALVYTVDSAFTTADAFVVSAGKIVAVGRA